MKLNSANLPAHCPNCGFSLREAAPGRSNPQNDYFHGKVIPIIAQHLGNTNEEMKEILKAMFLKDTTYINTKDGLVEVEYVKPTSSLTTVEFNIFIRDIAEWASAFLGVVVPCPDKVK